LTNLFIKYILLNMSANPLPLPLTLLLEITTRCNLKCRHCARTYSKIAPQDMSSQTFSRLEDIFPLVQTVVLGFDSGESFLHPYFFERFRLLKAKGVMVRIISNATLLDSEMAKHLVKEGLDSLVISLEAATPNFYNDIREGAALATVVKNIRRLNRVKKRYPYLNRVLLMLLKLSGLFSLDRVSKGFNRKLINLKVNSLVNRLAGLPMQLAMLFLPLRFSKKLTNPVLSINFTCMKQNIHELPSLVRLASHLGVDFIVLSALTEDNPWSRGRAVAWATLQTNSYFHAAQKISAQCGVKLVIQEENFSLKRYPLTQAHVGLTSLTKRLIKDCPDPWTSTYIRIHGDVHVCCYSPVEMGNINQQDFRDIWNSPAYNDFRQKLASPDPPEECRRCPLRRWIEI